MPEICCFWDVSNFTPRGTNSVKQQAVPQYFDPQGRSFYIKTPYQYQITKFISPTGTTIIPIIIISDTHPTAKQDSILVSLSLTPINCITVTAFIRLHFVFHQPLLHALDLVDRKNITKLTTPSGRVLYQVSASKKLGRYCNQLIKVLLRSNCRFFIFLHFRVQYNFLTHLAKFKSITNNMNRSRIIWAFIFENLRPPLLDLVPRLGCELEKMTSCAKNLTGRNYNNNKYRKSQEEQQKLWTCSSCNFLYLLLL